jgi:hypothetical protein
MSSIVKTVTPFLNKELLLQALDSVGCKYEIQGNEIVMLQDQSQRFIWDSTFGRFKFSYYSHNYSESKFAEIKATYKFLGPIEQSYNDLYRKRLEELERLHLEEERLRLEKERQECVEKQRMLIKANAKASKYWLESEKKVKNEIKLVFVRTT